MKVVNMEEINEKPKRKPEIIGEKQIMEDIGSIWLQRWYKQAGEGFKDPEVLYFQRYGQGLRSIVFPADRLEEVMSKLEKIKEIRDNFRLHLK